MEIASFVYAADASTQRDGAWKDDNSTEPWDRDFKFVICVRDKDFWDRNEIKTLKKEFKKFDQDLAANVVVEISESFGPSLFCPYFFSINSKNYC